MEDNGTGCPGELELAMGDFLDSDDIGHESIVKRRNLQPAITDIDVNTTRYTRVQPSSLTHSNLNVLNIHSYGPQATCLDCVSESYLTHTLHFQKAFSTLQGDRYTKKSTPARPLQARGNW